MSPAAAKKTVNDLYGPAPLVALELIEWRVDGKPNQGQGGPMARYVPYIDAARVAALLDEWVGHTNWRASYEPAKLAGQDVLWGIVEIRAGDEWVAKRDVGVASSFEKAKGLVSDAFKRAGCRMWGAGRNVYELPTLKAPCRIWTPPGKEPQAFPVDDTLPSILAQLKKLGYDASGGRVTGTDPGFDPDHDDLTDDTPPEQPRSNSTSSSSGARRGGTSRPAKKAAAGKPGGAEALTGTVAEIRNQVRARFDKLGPAEQATWVRTFGQPEDLKATMVRNAGPALTALEMTSASRPATPPASEPEEDAEPESVHARHCRLLYPLIRALTNEDLQAMFDNAEGVTQPEDLTAARKMMADLTAGALDEDFPEGVPDDQLNAWWNGE